MLGAEPLVRRNTGSRTPRTWRAGIASFIFSSDFDGFPELGIQRNPNAILLDCFQYVFHLLLFLEFFSLGGFFGSSRGNLAPVPGSPGAPRGICSFFSVLLLVDARFCPVAPAGLCNVLPAVYGLLLVVPCMRGNVLSLGYLISIRRMLQIRQVENRIGERIGNEEHSLVSRIFCYRDFNLLPLGLGDFLADHSLN